MRSWLVPVLAPALAITAFFALSPPAAASTEPPRCLRPEQIRQTQVVDDDTILFQMHDGKLWKNRLDGHCPGLRIAGGFAYDLRGDEICANLQPIRVLRSGHVCLLGEFSTPDPPKDGKHDEP